LKNYLITGGSGGVGKSLSELLISKGNKVYIFDIKPLKIKSKNIFFTKIDCSLEFNIKKIVTIFSKNKIFFDGIILCHGAHHTSPLLNTSVSDLKKIFDVNFFSHFYLVKNFYNLMNNYCKVISISSIAASTAIPYSFTYSSSKSSLESMFFSFYNEYKDKKIFPIIVQPGNINTGFNETGNNFSNKNLDSYEFYKKIVNKINSKYGMSSKSVAKKIINILNKKKPLPRYIVGKNAILANIVVRTLGIFFTLKFLKIFFKL
jgi:short-subunit dehydrogenase